ncbi:MAG: response regulator [Polyangiaceae bacterium]|nr:response regulator [Polyangiaceae bacterium]
MSGATDPRTGSAWRDTRISGLRQRVRDDDADADVDGQSAEIVELASSEPGPSEKHHRFVFEQMNEGAAYCRVLYDADRPIDFAFLAVNAAFERLTGHNGLAAKRLTELFPAIRESDPALFEICCRVARTGEPERFEIYVNAVEQWLCVSAFSPEPDHFAAVVDVITERKHAEQKTRAIFDHLPGATLVWQRTEGTFALVDLNEAARSAVARDADDCAGRLPDELLPGLPHLCEDLGRVCSERAAVRREVQCALPGTQGPRHLVLTYGFLPDEMVVLYTEDITLQRQAEEQLKLAQRLEAIGRLAGGIAHDFNNLLSVIVGTADFALSSLREGEEFHDDMVAIRDAGQRAAVLTRQLLAFSRRQLLQPEVVNLNSVVYGMESLLRRSLGEDIELSVVFADGLSKVKVDPGQIEQVIMNLAVNSRDAMPRGGKLTIETANVELDEDYAATHVSVEPGSYVLLSVSDSGCGMDERTREHLFEPFFTTREAGRGTGLGLAMVYGIVKQSGGSIWVYSEPGQGTTFRIYLPREPAGSPSIRAKERPSTPVRGPATVLIVEDEAAVRSVAQRILAAAGYTVLTASSGHEALSLCERHAGEIHLLFTDVVMPGMGGRELVERLLSKRPNLGVIYTSGYTDNAIVHHGTLEPGTNFLGKPFHASALIDKVKEVLGRTARKTG